MPDGFDRDGILKLLSAELSEKRLHHSVCVEERASELAQIHGEDADKAALAGLLHDIYHDRPKTEQLKYLESRGILLDIFAGEHPALWHAMCAAEYIKTLGVEDEDVITAVRCHTTGRKNMSLLEKIVFLADATSMDRDYPDVDKMRELADKSLDAAMLAFLSHEIKKLAENGKTITKDAWEAYNYFVHMNKTEDKL